MIDTTSTPLRYELVAELNDDARAAVALPLRIFNRAANPDYFVARERPENAPRPLYVLAFDADDAFVGGLIGETQFAWLRISILAVAQPSRGQGVGRALMAEAEKEARARGCRYVFLDTMEYQAPLFYQKLGYQVAGKLVDWDSHGHSQYLFVKHLAEPPPGCTTAG